MGTIWNNSIKLTNISIIQIPIIFVARTLEIYSPGEFEHTVYY